MQNLQNSLDENLETPNYRKSLGWDWYLVLGSVTVFAIAIALHFWQLGKLPYPVFDESLFGQYANEYLAGSPTWEGHPPLGKYFLMMGILIFGPNEIGYRVLGACFGSVLPLLAIGLVYRLSYNRNFALLSGLFLGSDGLFLVESRLGLINVFLVSFGLISQIFFLASLEHKGKLRTFLLCCSGVMLGAAASVKWNGLGFSLLVVLIVLLVSLIAKFFPKNLAKLGLLAEITTIHWWQHVCCLVPSAIAFYLVQWIPLFMLNSGGVEPASGFGAIFSFWESLVRVHEHIIWWHSADIVTTLDPEHPAHPYCSSAISWAVMAKPVGYYFTTEGDGRYRVVQGIGNPLLWWFSTLAIVTVSLGSLLPKFRKNTNIGATNYLLLGYFANYVPWLLVKRCLFVYHYMSSAFFSFVTLAWVVNQLLEQKGVYRYLGYAIIAIVVLTQIFFLPIWIGIPILPSEFYQRIWFMPDKIPGFNWI